MRPKKNRRRTDFKYKAVSRSKFGNSLLAYNYKFWSCTYCGLPLKNGVPFEMAYINGNPLPYVLCTPTCEKLQLKKIEMAHYDK